MTSQTLSTHQRQPAFDALKLFAIFLVLWGHAIQHFLSTEPFDNPLECLIYSFHMPLFMMISGYFAAGSLRASAGKFLWRKFRQLLLPCLTWGLLIYILLKGGQAILVGDRSASLADMLTYLFGNLWFLKSCFLCFLLAYPVYHFGQGRLVWIVLSVAVSLLATRFQLPMMYPCFLVGIELRRHVSWQKWLARNYALLGVGFVIMLCFLRPEYFDHWYLVQIGGGTIRCKLDSYVFVFAYRLVLGIVGSLFFIGFFQALFRVERSGKWVERICAWGQLTLGIYILQNIILETLLARVLKFDSLSLPLFNYVVAPLICLVVLLVCIGLIRLISRWDILAFLFLGKALPSAQREAGSAGSM